MEHGDGAVVSYTRQPFHVEQLVLPVAFHVKLEPARLALIHVKRPHVQAMRVDRLCRKDPR